MNAAPQGDGQTSLWADAHNHLHDARLAIHHRDLPLCIVNATREEDWDDVLALASSPGRHAALGIHPWFANTPLPGWDNRLRVLLEKHPAASIGECGLDVKSRSCPLELQIDVFEHHLRLARELSRPISIHCVGAWGRLMESLNREPPPARWLMHSFNGSPEMARHLVAMGAYFSISGRALHPSGEKTIRTFLKIPPSHILLETDAPYQPPPSASITHHLPHGLNHPSNLAAIGTAIARLLGYTPEDFAHLTWRNFHNFLNLPNG